VAERIRYFSSVVSGTLDGFPYLQFGDGPEVVVVIPGIDDSVHQFRWLPRAWAWYFAPLVTERRRVLVLSRPRGLPAAVSTDALADQYASIIERHLGSVDLVGISMGGLIAQHLAARHGHLVRRLALVVTGHQLGYAGADHGERLSRLATAGRWRAFFGHVNAICFSGAPRLVMHALCTILGSSLLGRRERAARDFAASANACACHDGSLLLSRITAPTLVWGARADCLFPVDVVATLAAALPHATLHLVDGPHAAFLQRRSEFHRAVGDFISADVDQPAREIAA
jgi:pimeloyl-ACP methyl ester carboxylesterase